jgi:hypothetical protein
VTAEMYRLLVIVFAPIQDISYSAHGASAYQSA